MCSLPSVYLLPCELCPVDQPIPIPKPNWMSKRTPWLVRFSPRDAGYKENLNEQRARTMLFANGLFAALFSRVNLPTESKLTMKSQQFHYRVGRQHRRRDSTDRIAPGERASRPHGSIGREIHPAENILKA